MVLDIGVWCRMPEPHLSENWLEKQMQGEGTLIAAGLDDMHAFHEKYPHVRCVQADGCALPFDARTVDMTIANAVLEHVPRGLQHRFVEELARVARSCAVLSVPDRLCPIEVHSRLLFVHWVPFWRHLLRRFGAPFWADENNLSSIFSRKNLGALLDQASPHRDKWKIRRQWFLFVPVSLIAELHRTGA